MKQSLAILGLLALTAVVLIAPGYGLFRGVAWLSDHDHGWLALLVAIPAMLIAPLLVWLLLG